MWMVILIAFLLLFCLDVKVSQMEKRNAQLNTQQKSSQYFNQELEPPVLFKESFSQEIDKKIFGKNLERVAVKQPLGEEGGLKKQPQFALVPNDEFQSQRRSGNSEEDWRTKMQSDSQCSGLSVKYGTPEQLPIVLLATHEGGGSDWLRKLVEVSTGFFVGIEDKQKQMELSLGLGSGFDMYDKQRKDEKHEIDDGTQIMTVTVKGYDRFRSTAIYLLRNPFESLVSTKAEQDPYLDGSVISGPLWETEVRQKTYNWLHRTRTWICAAQSLHFLHYEKLRKETKPSLEDLLGFLDVKKQETRLNCASKHGITDITALEKVIIKRGKKLKFPYGSTQARSIEGAICSINWLLKSKGFQPIPLELYVESMDKFFQGPFMPENLCEKTLQFEKSNCEKFVNLE